VNENRLRHYAKGGMASKTLIEQPVSGFAWQPRRRRGAEIGGFRKNARSILNPPPNFIKNQFNASQIRLRNSAPRRNSSKRRVGIRGRVCLAAPTATAVRSPSAAWNKALGAQSPPDSARKKVRASDKMLH